MRNMLSVLMVMVGAMGTTLGQIDNEFWFVAPGGHKHP